MGFGCGHDGGSRDSDLVDSRRPINWNSGSSNIECFGIGIHIPVSPERNRWLGEEGNASVEFALVAPLLMLIGLAVLQLMLALHVRTVITSAAIEGARVGAHVGSDLVMAEQRTRQVLLANIAGATVVDVHARRTTLQGVPMIAVQVDAELPLLGVYGPTTMTLTGHAYVE